jgi:GNAT superfamily N-acetyltransferase
VEVIADQTRALTFRRLHRGERAAVLEVFNGLSERSRALRFHAAKPQLSERELDDLSFVGRCGREAVVAIDEISGRVVGIARYVADATIDGEAEVAYAVVDDWQGRGVGRRLIVELGRLADRHGIDRLRGLVATGNAPALALLHHIGQVVRRTYEGGALEVVVAIRA